MHDQKAHPMEIGRVGSSDSGSDATRSEGVLERKGKPSSLSADALRRLRRNPGAVAGAIVLTVLVFSAVLAPVIAPHDPIEQDSQAIRAQPSCNHPFGTDSFGRDVFSRVLYGGRKSLPIGMVAVSIAAFVGVSFGLIA